MNAAFQLHRIAVLVSTGRHPVSGAPRYSRNDAAALEIGQRLAAKHHALLDVIHAGDAADPALVDYLALGAREVEVLTCAADEDKVRALSTRVRDYDLVLTGTRAEGAFDTGMLPYGIAAALGRALIGTAVDVDVSDGRAVIRQFLPKGLRRRVAATLPAVVAVHPLANARPRYAYARMRSGKIRPVQVSRLVDGEADAWTLGPVERKPVRLAAAEKRSGHARMLSATTTESRGGSVVIEGTAVEKAQMILGYLREHQLVDY
ncbi:electron transfer flavoprotein subunit beta/FixA family protein [Paraburkholderia sp. CNPSo 3157]|uniref:Electron transfer flavoprotein subunit beta/FixA family protein n=1 Tax=Paraburkholderia franconis TaxID=2654983 RepID=A0A7X1TLC9_9BURK|nr:electron transfer flavoprotein subunit beta/FixA family protein [Paraburkholderia franconis]MPW23505.1 electron transfer flavoprotein subunit beta/FixA family protein [Paraburkholderia franconis]